MLSELIGKTVNIQKVEKITGGYSNQTYSLYTDSGDYVLRKPPPGINIKSAHDVGREFKILQALEASSVSVPKPIIYVESSELIGTPYYIMEKVEGVVLRAETVKKIQPKEQDFDKLSQNTIVQLVSLHQMDVDDLVLKELGRPQGYVTRQVEGWIKRYHNAKTESIPSMKILEEWMIQNGDYSDEAALIHNDFKYDNLILEEEALSEIKAVLDWEMATIGHPLMDLGTTLAYWVEGNDPDALKAFNTTWLPGNYSRKEVAQYYAEISGRYIHNILFYTIYGYYKIAVIAQQIYKRFTLGKTKDPRFAMLIYVVKAAAEKGVQTIKKGEI